MTTSMPDLFDWLITFAIVVSLSPLGDSAEKRASRRSR